MSVRNFDKLFKPRSVALIGATPRPGAVGAVVARNLRRGCFAGELMFVNPHHDAMEGLTVYPDVASLPRPPDLAVIVTPPQTVPWLVDELAERGTRAAVVITAGFGELGEQGRALQQPYSMRQGRIFCGSWVPTASASWCRGFGSMRPFPTWRRRREILPSSASPAR